MGKKGGKETVDLDEFIPVAIELWTLRRLLTKKGIVTDEEFDAEQEEMMSEDDPDSSERAIDSLVRDAKRKEPARQIKSAHKKLRRKLLEGDEPGAAKAQAKLGDLHLESGEYEQSLSCYEQAAGLYRKLGEEENVAAMLANMASVELSRERYDEAQSYARKSLTMFRQMGAQEAIAANLQQLALIAEGRGDTVGAGRLYEECLSTWRRLKNDDGVLAALGPLADIAASADDTRRAKQIYEEALGLARKLGDEDMTADILRRMRKLK